MKAKEKAYADLQQSYKNLQTDYDNAQDELFGYQERISMVEDEADFMEDRIALVPEDSDYYHKFSCSVWQNYSGSWWGYNNEAARARGYTPCYLCH